MTTKTKLESANKLAAKSVGRLCLAIAQGKITRTIIFIIINDLKSAVDILESMLDQGNSER